MKEQVTAEVMQQMARHLDGEQMKRLAETLKSTLRRYDVAASDALQKDGGLDELTEKFIAAKRIEGCSEKTLKYYRSTISSMTASLGGVCGIGTEELRGYLTEYQTQRRSSRVTIDNIRRILSSFFSWLEDEDYIVKSPMRRIRRIRTPHAVKGTYADEELEKLRDACTEPRDLAILDLLATSGMRVGELVALDRADVDFHERECVVLGKGNRERVVYFDARAKIHLERYLATRDDDSPALFVSLRAPHRRLQIGGVEARLRALGRQLLIAKVHPHKFRRTLATAAIDKGMPIEQLQRLLGHQRIDTTLQYAMVKQANVKLAHRKFIG